jgi:hypothetical protein
MYALANSWIVINTGGARPDGNLSEVGPPIPGRGPAA